MKNSNLITTALSHQSSHFKVFLQIKLYFSTELNASTCQRSSGSCLWTQQETTVEADRSVSSSPECCSLASCTEEDLGCVLYLKEDHSRLCLFHFECS